MLISNFKPSLKALLIKMMQIKKKKKKLMQIQPVHSLHTTSSLTPCLNSGIQ